MKDKNEITEFILNNGMMLRPSELSDGWCMGLNIGAHGMRTSDLHDGGGPACVATFVGAARVLCTDIFATESGKRPVLRNQRLATFSNAGCDCTHVTRKFPITSTCALQIDYWE